MQGIDRGSVCRAKSSKRGGRCSTEISIFEYYLSLDEILFFETDEAGISAHTKTDAYQTKYKLYELEDMLPGFFMRVSKSTILNTNHIYSINRNLTASSVVAFSGTHKQVYVSRYYYKLLISKLEEKRLHR